MVSEILFLLLGGVIGGALGVAVLLLKKSQGAASSNAFSQLKAENDFFKKDRENLQSEVKEKEKRILEMTETLSRLETEKNLTDKTLVSQQRNFEEMQQKFRLEFESLAQKILEEKAKTYKTRSEESLSALLAPLKARITDFQKQVAECYEREGRERHSLESTVKELQMVHQNALQETTRLTETLKGSTKIQGDWGEMVLERILEDSGLRRDEEFILQGKGLELKTDEGNRLKPDVVIRLPEERHIVIDSKVSLIHYHEYVKAKTTEEKEKWAGQMIQSLSQHIQSLSEKSYSVSSKLIAPDFTFMFIPLEGVFSLVLHLEQTLFERAWNKSIIIVTPTTLLAALRTVSSVWKMEKQNKNALKIASESGKMYDKLVGFVSDMKNIGRGLEMAEKSYTEAFNKLKQGRGHLIGRAEKIKQLGAAASKELSAGVQPDSEKT